MSTDHSQPPGFRVRALPADLHDRLTDGLRGLRHDTAGHLVAVYATADLLADQRDTAPSTLRMIERMRKQALELGALLTSVCAPAIPRRALPDAIVQEVLAECAATASRAGASWRRDDEPEALKAVAASLSPDGLRRLCLPLLRNALEAGPGAGRRALTVTFRCKGSGHDLRVGLWDDGPGCDDVSAVARGRVRARRGHLGIGLAGAASVVEAAGMALYIHSSADPGFSAWAAFAQPPQARA